MLRRTYIYTRIFNVSGIQRTTKCVLDVVRLRSLKKQ